MPLSQINSASIENASVAQVDLATGVAGTGPAFSAYPSGAQSLTASTLTKVQFNTEDFDTNTCFDSATNYRFTPTVAGYYQLNLTVAVSSAVAVQAAIYKNGSVFQYGNYAPTGNWSVASAVLYLNGTTDYVEGYIFSSGIASTQAGAFQRFSGAMVRGA